MSVDLTKYADDLLSEDLFPTGKLFRITFDAGVGKLKIIAVSYDDLCKVRNAFSTTNPGAFFSQQYGYSTPDKIYCINKFGYFSSGLLPFVLQFIKITWGNLDCVILSSACKRYIFDYITPLKAYIDEPFDVENISEDSGLNALLRNSGKTPLELRDYLKTAISALIFNAYGRGMIESPTGSGKSFTLANFIWTLHKHINDQFTYLILVPNKQLVDLFYKDLLDYGYKQSDITKFTAGLKKKDAFNKDAMVIIANRQYVFNHKNELPKIDVLICDEVHLCTAGATSDFIDQCEAKIRIGCSGTITVLSQYLKWTLNGMFGKICFTEDIVNLLRQNYITGLKITAIKVTDVDVLNNKDLLFHTNSNVRYNSDDLSENSIHFNDAFTAERDYINENYIKLYTPVINYINTLDENTLVLFDKVEIGRNLNELAKTLCPDKLIFYIDGSINVDEREKIRATLETNGNCILFGLTACVSTGINVKRLNHIVFAFLSKGYSRVLLSIGRTLRLHQSKDYSHLVDICFNFKYSTKQYKERLLIYKRSYNITKPNEILAYNV